MKLGLSPKVKSHAAMCWQCQQVGMCTLPVLTDLAHAPGGVRGSWTRLGEEGMLGFSTSWHDTVGLSRTISAPSKGYWPHVQNAIFLKIIFSKGALTLNKLLLEALKSSWIKWHAHQHVLFLLMVKNIEVNHLKLPIKEGSFKKSFTLVFPINWLNSFSWKATEFCFIYEAFCWDTGHHTDLKMNWQ